MKSENSQQDELNRLEDDLGEGAENLSPDEFDAVVEALALGFVAGEETAPSPSLRERVLQKASDAVSPENSQSISEPKRSRVTSLILPWAAAAAFAILATVGWMKFYSLDEEMTESERQLSAAAESVAGLQIENHNLAETVEKLKNTSELDQLKIAALESELDRAYFGLAVWDAKKERGILRVARIPDLEGEAKDYQLWVVDPQYDTPVDGGVFQVDENGAATISFKPDRKIGTATAFAVSLEKKGGVPVAEGPMVLVGAL